MRHQITIFRTVPTTFRTFMATLSDGVVFPSVRILSMGGEPLFRPDVQDRSIGTFRRTAVLVHPFGPTECMAGVLERDPAWGTDRRTQGSRSAIRSRT